MLHLLAWLLLVAMPIVGADNKDYRTDRLLVMAEKAGFGAMLDTLVDGEHIGWVSYLSQPVTVIKEGKRVTHIGYSFFSSEQRDAFGRTICDFLERYALELDIPSTLYPVVATRLHEDGVTVRYGSFTQAHQLCADSTVSIYFQAIDERNYSVCWRRDTTRLFQVSFPVEYDLLVGTNMEERERRLPEEIGRDTVTADDPALPSFRMLRKVWKENYYTLKGESYLMDNLNANQYFELNEKGQLRPIYNKVYPLESLANLLTTTYIDNNYVLDIQFRKYGFNTDTLCVPLSQWIRYCRHTGCKLFFGIVSLDEDKEAVCELLTHNGAMGYNHVMKITFPMNILEARKGHIQARLNSYVNTSRVKNLFGEY